MFHLGDRIRHIGTPDNGNYATVVGYAGQGHYWVEASNTDEGSQAIVTEAAGLEYARL